MNISKTMFFFFFLIANFIQSSLKRVNGFLNFLLNIVLVYRTFQRSFFEKFKKSAQKLRSLLVTVEFAPPLSYNFFLVLMRPIRGCPVNQHNTNTLYITVKTTTIFEFLVDVIFLLKILHTNNMNGKKFRVKKKGQVSEGD